MRMGGESCTRGLCAPESCCNTCSAGVLLGAPTSTLRVSLVGDGLGCKGTNCGLTCSPKAGTKVQAWGTIEVVDQGDGYHVVQLRVTRLE